MEHGLKTRREIGMEITGGGTADAVSFTLDPRVAEAICLGINVIRMGLRGELNWHELLIQAAHECPETVADMEVSAPLIRGEDPYKYPRKFVQIYKTLTFFGKHYKECYDPLFWGAGIAEIADLDPADIGIVEARVQVPRVCVGAEGAYRMGFVSAAEAQWWSHFLNRAANDCETCVDYMKMAAWSERPGARPRLRQVDFARHPYRMEPVEKKYRKHLAEVPESIGGYPVVDSGVCWPHEVSTFTVAMSELRVYATPLIEMVGVFETLQDVYTNNGFSPERVTYPFFAEYVPQVAVP
jgi:hypothetical protein